MIGVLISISREPWERRCTCGKLGVLLSMGSESEIRISDSFLGCSRLQVFATSQACVRKCVPIDTARPGFLAVCEQALLSNTIQKSSSVPLIKLCQVVERGVTRQDPARYRNIDTFLFGTPFTASARSVRSA